MLPKNTINELCSFYAMPSVTLVSLATIYNHFTRTAKDFPNKDFCFKDRKVVANHEEYCLFFEMLEYTRSQCTERLSLLPVSKVPLDMFARTHNKPVLLKETIPQLAPLQTDRRAKMYHWINLMQHGMLCTL